MSCCLWGYSNALASPGGIDSLLRGLVGRPAKLSTQDHMLVNALREKLFKFVEHVAMDLGSLNMQRGRDHALPGTTLIFPPSHVLSKVSFLTGLFYFLSVIKGTMHGASCVACLSLETRRNWPW